MIRLAAGESPAVYGGIDNRHIASQPPWAEAFDALGRNRRSLRARRKGRCVFLAIVASFCSYSLARVR